jgi:hypothetical protein
LCCCDEQVVTGGPDTEIKRQIRRVVESTLNRVNVSISKEGLGSAQEWASALKERPEGLVVLGDIEQFGLFVPYLQTGPWRDAAEAKAQGAWICPLPPE